MTGLNQVLKKSQEIVNSSITADDKTKLQALALANVCYKYKMNLVTNGVIVSDAIKFVNEKKEELSEVSVQNTNEQRRHTKRWYQVINSSLEVELRNYQSENKR